MKIRLNYLIILSLLISIFFSCKNTKKEDDMNEQKKAVFLHHSTGNNIWKGNVSKYSYKLFKEGDVLKWLKKFNKSNKTNYIVEELVFPKKADMMFI